MSYDKSRIEEHLFHAFVSGLGGYIERDDVRHPIPLGGGLALSVSGGLGTTCQSNYDFVFMDKNRKRAADFRLQAEKIVTVVSGTEHKDGWRTTAQSELVNLDINGVVRADLVRAVVSSFHRKRENLDQKKPEAEVWTTGSQFVNLTIKGVPLQLTPDEALEQYSTHDALRRFAEGSSDEARAFRKQNFLEKRGGSGKEDLYICDMEGYQSATHLRCSIYKKMEFERECEGVRQHCYSLHIPDFGRLYIGEVIVSNDEKQLNMLRFNLGCDVCGDGTGGSSSVNGATVP